MATQNMQISKYQFGIIDPPFEYDNKQTNDPKRAGIVYPTLSMKELSEIPIGKAFEKDSLLVIWTTYPKLMNVYDGDITVANMIRSWNFEPVTVLLTWIKINKKGLAVYEDTDLLAYDQYRTGTGYYTNSNAEVAIVARRGKSLERVEKNVKQLLFAPIGIHSAKPQEQYNRYDRLWHIKEKGIKAIEIFARKDNPPPSYYDATGLDFDSIDIRDWIGKYV